MDDTVAPQHGFWRSRLQRIGTQVRRLAPFAGGVLAAFVALLFYGVFYPDPPPLTEREVSETVAQALASATPPPAYSSSVYRAILPSLVFVEAQFPGEDGEGEFGFGTGVVINDNGDILTSLHVVENATDIRVTFADGTESSAEVIVEQPENDIAGLRANQPPLQFLPATLGNPNAMRVGDEAFVVGHPLGLVGSMSAGVISGFDRSFQLPGSQQKLEGLIQIDAAVNPGNSGGPLLNRSGQVVGIIAALANPTEQDVFIGIGFAVPINTAATAVGLPPH